MSIEIERKFLVKNDSWKGNVQKSLDCKQGYIISDAKKTVRIRILGEQGFLTVKGATSGISRMEFEYEIDLPDAKYMLMLCDHVLDKTRHFINHNGLTWELDEFHGMNAGLVMAELELESVEQIFELPIWAGEEVSGDERYFNGYLSKYPYTTW